MRAMTTNAPGAIIMTDAGATTPSGEKWPDILIPRKVPLPNASRMNAMMVSAIVNVLFLAAYPLWSLIMITLALLVVWAVIVHGSEMKND